MKDGCASAGCAASGEQDQQAREEALARRMRDRLARIRHKVLVLSGKGGVGKSTVAVNLAASLATAGNRVGLLDVDFHGPSVPTLLGLTGMRAEAGGNGMRPVIAGNLKVMSISFLLGERDAAVIWRGPMKMGAIRQLLADVEWGDLDYLIIDSPPGTGDEPLSVCQLINAPDGAVLVTTPQEVSLSDVRRSVTFCRQLELPVLGVIENMSGFVCSHCGEVAEIFKAGGGESMSADMGVPFLGRIPLDPDLVRAGDEGTAFVTKYPGSPAAQAFSAIVETIAHVKNRDDPVTPSLSKGDSAMRIAIPVAAGKLAMHFGHCEAFALLDVDASGKQIVKRTDATPPAHAPGVLPKWLAQQKAEVIIAGGMGSRAQALFAENGIDVIVGAPAESPEALVAAYLDETLATGGNICDH